MSHDSERVVLPEKVHIIKLCGLAAEASIADAEKAIEAMAGKAFHEAVRETFGFASSYAIEQRFSPPGQFRVEDGQTIRPHWWDTLRREGKPNLLKRHTHRDAYDRVAEVAKESDIPGKVLEWTLWRLLHPAPLSPFELHTALLDLQEVPDVSLFRAASNDATFARMVLELVNFRKSGRTYDAVLLAFHFLRSAEQSGEWELFRRALHVWYPIFTTLEKDPIFGAWATDLEAYVDRFLRRTLALVAGPDGTLYIAPAICPRD